MDVLNDLTEALEDLHDEMDEASFKPLVELVHKTLAQVPLE